MSILFDNPPPAIGCGDPGDPIDFGVLFPASAHMSALVEAANTKQAVFDYNFKDCSAGGISRLHIATTLGNNGNYFYIGQESDDLYSIFHGTIDSTLFYVKSVGKLRDKASHYQPHVRIDTTQAVASDRIQLWLDGVRMILTGTFPAQNADMYLLGGSQYHYIGSWFGTVNTPGGGGDVILSRVIYEDSLVPQRSDFGYFNAYNQWVNKTYSGPAVYHLAFKNGLDLGADETGVHDFTPNGLTANNQVVDTPSSNHATFDPANKNEFASLTSGNRRVSYNLSDWGAAATSCYFKSGCFYAEISVGSFDGQLVRGYGLSIGRAISLSGIGSFKGGADGNHCIRVVGQSSAKVEIETDGVSTEIGTGTFDYLKISADFASGKCWLGYDDIWIGGGDPEAGTSPTLTGIFEGMFFGHSYNDYGDGGTLALVSKVSGFKVPGAYGYDCPEILTPENYVTSRIKLAGADVDDAWDMTVGKSLVMTFNLDTGESRVVDTVRGVGFAWETNTVNAEIDNESGGVTAFTNDGFQVGNAAAYQGRRLDVMLRASPKSGMDIIGPIDHVTGTPTTVSQLTGGIVDMCLLIPLDGGDRRWYHRLLPGKYNRLNSGGDSVTDASGFSSNANTLTIGASVPSGRWMAYPFRAVPQFSAFPTYQGTANTDGAFVPADFLPRLMLTDDIGAGVNGYPVLIDAALNPNNPGDKLIYPNTADGEVTSLWGDFLSNGVKFRAANHPNGGYPYACGLWAQTPGKFARAR